MRLVMFLLLAAPLSTLLANDPQPLETPSTPFDFDNFRRTPMQVRDTSSPWASRDNANLQRELIAGDRGKKTGIAARAAALFPDPQEIPIRGEPEPLPTPNQLTDEITVANHGETSKGQRDLLTRSRVADRLDLTSMSETDYELYVAQYRVEQERVPPAADEGLLRPMPTLMNSKTGGPPHGYSVSQAGVGSRAEPRNDQNPFEDLIRALRLDQRITKGTDPLPAPSARLAVVSTSAVPAAAAPESGAVDSDKPDDQP